MSKHTDKKWVCIDENGNCNPDHDWSVSNDDCAMSSALPVWEGDEVIAFVVHRSDDWYKNEPALVEERARLIAASPDLLEALREVVAYCKEHGHEWSVLVAADAAIAKATGERND